MCLTFEMADSIFKEYDLVPHQLKNGQAMDYAFQARKSRTGKQSVATNIKPSVNGGVVGYLYVGYLNEFKFKKVVTFGYPYIKTLDEYIRINNLSEEELRGYLDRITSYYS